MKYKKISEMTPEDKMEFFERIKVSLVRDYGVSWETIEQKIIEEIDNTFDDEKFLKMNADCRIDAAYAREEFGDNKPEIVDYMLWTLKFVTKSEYIEWG